MKQPLEAPIVVLLSTFSSDKPFKIQTRYPSFNYKRLINIGRANHI